MNKIIFTLAILTLALAACAAPITAIRMPETTLVPVDSGMPVPGMHVTEVVIEGKRPTPSFESQLYVDETAGFALDYPAGWTAKETMTGERGTQSVLLSAPEIADLAIIPAGESRVAVTVNRWVPKNDLVAFVQNRKTAWETSGFTILEEEPLTLELGLSAVRFAVQTPDGLTSEWLLAAIGDQYVSISGEGDLDLVKEILSYLRPIGP